MFWRRKPAADNAATTQPGPVAKEGGGKGRPTPSRREAEAARKKRVAAPKNRKEAQRQQRDRTREQRAKMRVAMQTGDDRYLPARDQGPVRRFVRDYVDSRWTIGQFLIPAFVVIFVIVTFTAKVAPSLGTYAWLAVIGIMAADSVRIMRGLKAGITERFGAEQTKGITMYALMRSWQMRRLRLPKPQVARGAKI